MLAAGMLAACSFSGGGGADRLVVGGVHNDVSTLDPQVVTWGEWLDSAALLEGLVVLNSTGTGVVPGVAQSWTESADGLTYTFALRDTKWSDGQPLTAQDFLFAYQRLLKPSTAGTGVTQGARSFVPSIGIKGAQDFVLGKTKDWKSVGIQAPDDRTVRFTLASPNNDFLIGLTHPSMLPLPAHVLKAKPKDWEKPANWVGNGAYVVKTWTLNSAMTLVPNKQYWDQSGVKLSQITLHLTDDLTQAGVHYQSKQVDVALLLSPDVKRFQADPALRARLVPVRNAYSSYLAVLHSKNPALDDVRVRQALSLAMGREGIVQTCSACRPSYSLVSDTVPAAREAAGVTENVGQAKALLAQAGYRNGAGLPTVHILVNNTPNPLLEAIVDTWQRNLGIKAKVDVLETGVYVQRRQALQEADTIGFYEGSFASYSTWRSWTATLWDPPSVKKFSIPSSKWQGYLTAQASGDPVAYANANASPPATQFGTLVDQAIATKDPAAAIKLFQQAARVRQDTYLILPTIYTDSMYVVRSGVTGLQPRLGPLLPFTFKGVGVTAQSGK
ncbi:peptide ABC transporter substrate-binding protein [Fodinicola feengrottensis]|uniref:peptide ABC transporter substrate-binding protein n=1 Tax=Fodinicola feengrottensis TaxID=435914 RepID=UPI0013CF525E|nr:peptide ABC transporter substrate-binding protein [Fodinicola feengrottensis]